MSASSSSPTMSVSRLSVWRSGPRGLSGLDPDPGAMPIDGAEIARRPDRLTYRLAMGDQRFVNDWPEPFRDKFDQAALRLLGGAGPEPAHAVGDAVDVRVDRDRFLTEGVNEDAVGDFAAD